MQYTIDEIVTMQPDSLTVHSLAIKRASKLSRWIERCDNVKDVGLYIEKIDEMIERKKKLLSEPLEGSMRRLL